MPRYSSERRTCEHCGQSISKARYLRHVAIVHGNPTPAPPDPWAGELYQEATEQGDGRLADYLRANHLGCQAD